MSENRAVYKNPKPGQPLMSVISSGCKTPFLPVKFCNLIKPFYYANSPTVPRFSITCSVDPEEFGDFLNGINTIEKNEGVETIIKNEIIKEGSDYLKTGNLLIKFQTKEKIPVYLYEEQEHGRSTATPIDLEDELAKGESVMVVYDILRYTKKNPTKTEHGISFKPSCIYYKVRG